MGRFAPRYTAAQKAAFFELVLEKGETTAQAVRMLARGYSDLEPFDLNLNTARQLKKRELEKRQSNEFAQLVSEAREVSVKGIGARLGRVLDIEVTKVEKRAAKPNQTVDPRQLTQLASAYKTLQSTVTKGNAAKEPEASEKGMSAEAAAMLGEPSSNAQTPSQHTTDNSLEQGEAHEQSESIAQSDGYKGAHS